MMRRMSARGVLEAGGVLTSGYEAKCLLKIALRNVRLGELVRLCKTRNITSAA
jgi:hypothetical protein